MTTNEATEKEVVETLRRVIDPELGCNIVDLGLVYGITIAGAKVKVTMTLTTPGCPMHESIGWGVQSALLQIDWVNDAEVELVWDPPWNPSRINDAGRAVTVARSS